MCLIFQGTKVQVQVLKPCKSVQESSEEVMCFKIRQIARQMYLSGFKMWSSTDKLDSYIYQELRKLVFQIWFHVYPCVCV